MYHRAYYALANWQGTVPNQPSSQPSFYDQDVATFTVPQDISPWSGSSDLNGANASPQLYSEQALAPPRVKEEDLVSESSSTHTFSTISPSFTLQSSTQDAPKAYSPHLFHTRPLSSPHSAPSSNASASTSPSPASASSRMHTFAVAPQQPSVASSRLTTQLASGPSAPSKSEPADAPWNLVPYNAPFKMRDGKGGAGASTQDGGIPSVMAASGVFLRSPTPTKRQRTNQACEKCRDRKAKVSDR